MIGTTAFVIVGILLFAIGLLGILLWRNMLIMLMSIEIILNGINLMFIAFSAQWQHLTGQIVVLFIMLITAAEVAVALALTAQIFRYSKNLDTGTWNRLKH